jgi:mRNA interferase MazF
MVKIKRKNYIPDQGDFIWIEFKPQAGHEQAGVRPALVISPASYNGAVGLALMCPITSKVKGYPFEVLLSSGKKFKLNGAVLSDQIKNLDWRIRKAKFIAKASPEIMKEVIEKIHAIIAYK